jgi:hypothetical protein
MPVSRPPRPRLLGIAASGAALGCVLIYAALFGIGYTVFNHWARGLALAALALAGGCRLSRNARPIDGPRVRRMGPAGASAVVRRA